VDVKKLIPTGYLLDYLNLLAQQISPPTTYICWANKTGYIFFSFLPSPPARTRTRRRCRRLLPPAARLLPNGVGTAALPDGSAVVQRSFPSLLLYCPSPMLSTVPIFGLRSRPAGGTCFDGHDLNSPPSPFRWRSASGKSHPICFSRELSMVEFFYGNKEEDDMWVLNVIDC